MHLTLSFSLFYQISNDLTRGGFLELPIHQLDVVDLLIGCKLTVDLIHLCAEEGFHFFLGLVLGIFGCRINQRNQFG